MVTEAGRIEAVYDRRLRNAAQDWSGANPQDQFALKAVQTCAQIEVELSSEIIRLNGEAAQHGIDVGFEASPQSASQTMFVVARPTDASAMKAMATLLIELGYHGWETAAGPPRVFTSTTESSFMIEVDMPSGIASLAWRGAESLRSRLKRGAEESIGPHLATPLSLVPELLAFAKVTSDDVVVDLGCGDGRLVVEAARHSAARAIGVENDASLIRLANERIIDAGVTELVNVVHADATTYDLSEATVVMIFLPPPLTAALVPEIRKRLAPGARLLAHEQFRVDHQVTPTESRVLLSHNAITVGHLWL